ncbi:MAG: flavodoxin [Candidatus Auribacter fodinae]|jgi:flavodoxin I|uniref:Flavodoxin n=1 Tax=Candidatus Auribacter fodinae TaxID=2093366 RepID=A0A3A4R0J5_9BACT|nr:MAG: flavodoxin [Candidatus Auribacter fodinae]
MGKSIIIYGSTAGNTEFLAYTILQHLRNANRDVVIKNVIDVVPGELHQYDELILGCSTWENGSMQTDFGRLYKSMLFMSFDGKRFALFGRGRRAYGHFCQALDTLENALSERGAQEIMPSLKIDGDAAQFEHEIREWSHSVADALAEAHR